MKKGIVLAAIFAVVGLGGTLVAYNSNVVSRFGDLRCTDILLDGNDILDSGSTTRITVGSTNTVTGNLNITGYTDWSSSYGSILSTTTTSGNSVGPRVYVYLGGATAAVEGSLIVATTPVAGQGVSGIVSAASNNQTGWIGFAAHAASTGTFVGVYTAGSFALVRSSGTVNAGDVLVSTGTAGYVAASNTPTTGADAAVALGAGVAAGGLVRARVR